MGQVLELKKRIVISAIGVLSGNKLASHEKKRKCFRPNIYFLNHFKTNLLEISCKGKLVLVTIAR